MKLPDWDWLFRVICFFGGHRRAWRCDDVALPLCAECGCRLPLKGDEYERPKR